MGTELTTSLNHFIESMEIYKNYFSGLCIMCHVKERAKELTQRELRNIGKELGIIQGARMSQHMERYLTFEKENGVTVAVFEMGLIKTIIDSAEKLTSNLQNYILENPGNTHELKLVLKRYEPNLDDFISYKCLMEIRQATEVIQFINEVYDPEIYQIETEGIAPTNNQIVMLLHELGILDFLKDKYPNIQMSETNLGLVLGEITGRNEDSMRKGYRAIIHNGDSKNSNPYNKPDNVKWLEYTLHKLRLN